MLRIYKKTLKTFLFRLDNVSDAVMKSFPCVQAPRQKPSSTSSILSDNNLNKIKPKKQMIRARPHITTKRRVKNEECSTIL